MLLPTLRELVAEVEPTSRAQLRLKHLKLQRGTQCPLITTLSNQSQVIASRRLDIDSEATSSWKSNKDVDSEAAPASAGTGSCKHSTCPESIQAHAHAHAHTHTRTRTHARTHAHEGTRIGALAGSLGSGVAGDHRGRVLAGFGRRERARGAAYGRDSEAGRWAGPGR